MEDQTDTQDKRWDVYINLKKTLRDLIKDFKKIKFNVGWRVHDISRDTKAIYIRVLFRLLELITLDVANGTVVIVDKKRGSKFYVASRSASKSMIEGKGWEKAQKKSDSIPKLDLMKLGYKVPFFAFDPGGKLRPVMVMVPKYIYAVLVENANKGMKFAKSSKSFIWEVKKE
ncbi:MAG: hypothetical protein KAH32_03795 [Chlamydiia bacterium]|nr:hypothetical protein [Chlamydiia bacterium]